MSDDLLYGFLSGVFAAFTAVVIVGWFSKARRDRIDAIDARMAEYAPGDALYLASRLESDNEFFPVTLRARERASNIRRLAATHAALHEQQK